MKLESFLGSLEPWDLQHEQDFGDVDHETWVSKVEGEIHDAPTCVNLRKIKDSPSTIFPSAKERGGDVALIGLHLCFSVKAKLLAFVNSVGVEILFRDDELALNKGKLCRVIGQLPSAKFETIAEFGVEAKNELSYRANLAFGTEYSLNFPSPNNETESIFETTVPSLKVGVSSNLEAGLFFNYKIERCRISASGMQHRKATWTFYESPDDGGCLTDRDLETWTFLAFDQYAKKLNIRVRLNVETTIGIVPLTLESPWKEFEFDVSGDWVEATAEIA